MRIPGTLPGGGAFQFRDASRERWQRSGHQSGYPPRMHRLGTPFREILFGKAIRAVVFGRRPRGLQKTNWQISIPSSGAVNDIETPRAM